MTAKYADGSDYDCGNPISNYTLTFKSGDSFVEGKNTIVASWNGLSVEFSVEAVEAALNPDSVEITVYNPYNDIIYTRWGLDKLLPYIKVSAEYTDGTKYPGGVGLGGIALSYTGVAAALCEGENVIFASFGGITRELTVYAVIPAATVQVDGGEEVCYSLFSEKWFKPLNSEGKTVRVTLYKDIVDGAAGASGGMTQHLNGVELTGNSLPREVSLDLNGHIIDRNGTEQNPLTNGKSFLFYLEHISFTILDSDPGAEHTERLANDAEFPTGGVITGAYYQSSESGYTGVIYIGRGASLTLEGGTIYKNTGDSSDWTYSANQGTVRVEGGAFTMNGGAIVGNTYK